MLLFPSLAAGQAHESADTPVPRLAVGGEFSVYNPDYYCPDSSPFSCGGGESLMKGIGTFVDYHVISRLGVEGEARWLRWDGLAGQVEAT
jgi:hypothetical protein